MAGCARSAPGSTGGWRPPGPGPCAASDALSRDAGRTVIFTTHHLDEAEALSDCVAVLQQGGLRFCGPPAHLTEAYGQGLSLTLTRQVRGHAPRGRGRTVAVTHEGPA